MRISYNGITHFATLSMSADESKPIAVVGVHTTILEGMTNGKIDTYLMGLMDQGMRYNPLLSLVDLYNDIPDDWVPTNISKYPVIVL